MEENAFAAVPTALYGVVLFMAAIAYWILQRAIRRSEGRESALPQAIGSDRKGRISQLIHLVAIPAAFVNVWISGICYVAVALIWLVPDTRIERVVG